MGEPHLRSVDPDGTTTAPTPDPTASAAGPADPGDGGKPTRSRPAARPKLVVPTSRMSVDTQVKALRVICMESRGGQETVNAEMMGKAMGLAAATAPLNNGFFVEVGLVEKRGRGEYLPTALALEFQRTWSFNRDDAFRLLAPQFADTWFMEVVRNQIELHGGPVATADMIRALASRAETDDTYSKELGFILEWLEMVGIISTANGAIELTTVADPAPAAAVPPAPPGDGGGPVPPAGPATTVAVPVVEEPIVQASTSPTVISMSVSINVSADDLARLEADQIAALFEGAGKLVAIQVALRDD